jgi:sensor histidine kinase regulating citrate/malate metabolism
VTLGNLLDNAVEACMKVPNHDDRFIRLTVKNTDAALIIHIVNSASHGNGTFATDKPDRDRHGLGFYNIRAITDKYGGVFEAESHESQFESTVILPLKDEDYV